MERLQVLQVSSNRLVKLPSAMADHSPLQLLSLHSNQIASLPSHLLIKTNKYKAIVVDTHTFICWKFGHLPLRSLMGTDTYLAFKCTGIVIKVAIYIPLSGFRCSMCLATS